MTNSENWRPTANWDQLRRRAELQAQVRNFFARNGVLEVETPLLASAPVSDPFIEAVATQDPLGGASPRYLQTSPEYAMKRLLAAGAPAIYQLCKAFRQGERGRRHNPEFTMLEWYRPGWNEQQLMDEVAALVIELLGERPVRRVTYRELFAEFAIDPHTASVEELEALARRELSLQVDDGDRDMWLQLLLTERLESRLGRGEYTFLTDYPASQSALARVELDAQGEPVARRFELYVDGIELANGYYELCDAEEQAARFATDLNKRRELGLPQPPIDEYLLAAMERGLPECAGVAMGFDRLAMLAMGVESIDQVVALCSDRA